MTDVVAVTRIEFEPISEGDIVTEIKSEQWGDFGNHPFDFGNYWTTITRSKSSGTASKFEPANNPINQQVLVVPSDGKASPPLTPEKTIPDIKLQSKDKPAVTAKSSPKTKPKTKEDTFRESVRQLNKF